MHLGPWQLYRRTHQEARLNAQGEPALVLVSAEHNGESIWCWVLERPDGKHSSGFHPDKKVARKEAEEEALKRGYTFDLPQEALRDKIREVQFKLSAVQAEIKGLEEQNRQLLDEKKFLENTLRASGPALGWLLVYEDVFMFDDRPQKGGGYIRTTVLPVTAEAQELIGNDVCFHAWEGRLVLSTPGIGGGVKASPGELVYVSAGSTALVFAKTKPEVLTYPFHINGSRYQLSTPGVIRNPGGVLRQELHIRDLFNLPRGVKFVVFWAKDDNADDIRCDFEVQTVKSNNGSVVVTTNDYEWRLAGLSDVDGNALDTGRGLAYFYQASQLEPSSNG